MNFNWKEEYFRYHRYFFNLGKITKIPQVSSFAWLSLSIFAVSFFSLMAIRPTLITITSLNEEIKEKKEASQQLQTKINSIVAAQAEFAKNVNSLPLLNEAFPEKSDFPRLALFFEEMANASGVELSSLEFEKIGEANSLRNEPTSPTLPLSFSVVASGNYAGLKDFLNSVEMSRRIIKIQTAYFAEVKRKELSQLSLQIQGEASFGKVLVQ